MTTEKIQTYSILEWTFRIISALFGIAAFGCFIILLTEGAEIPFLSELLLKVLELLAFIITTSLTLLFSAISNLYKSKLNTALKRLEKRAAARVELKNTYSALEEDRKKKREQNIDVAL